MKTILVILAIAFLPFTNLFAEEYRVVEAQQQTRIEGSMNKETSNCNEHVVSERVVAWQNTQAVETAETEQDKCFRKCEEKRTACYKKGKSNILCESEYSKCAIPCT